MGIPAVVPMAASSSESEDLRTLQEHVRYLSAQRDQQHAINERFMAQMARLDMEMRPVPTMDAAAGAQPLHALLHTLPCSLAPAPVQGILAHDGRPVVLAGVAPDDYRHGGTHLDGVTQLWFHPMDFERLQMMPGNEEEMDA